MVSLDIEDIEEFDLDTLIEAEAAYRKYHALADVYDESGPYGISKYPKHQEVFEATAKYDHVCAMGGNGTGKALIYKTKVATPSGWVEIGSLRVGDQVIAGDGKVTTVTGVFPQGEVELLDFVFDGGQTITCCVDHLWVTMLPKDRWSKSGRWQTLPAKGIPVGNTPKSHPVMPASPPWQIERKAVSIDPYLLGAILGNGCLKGAAGFSTGDSWMRDEVARLLPHGVSLIHNGGCDYRISSPGGISAGPSSNRLISELRELGLFGLGSPKKFIPKQYLLNDVDSRLALFRGLMDTDGSICAKSGFVEFSTSSERLAEDMTLLAESLGCRVKTARRTPKFTYKGERKSGLPSFRLAIRSSMCPFRIPRKADRWAETVRRNDFRVLKEKRPAGRGQAVCISVESQTRTYVCEHGIVTHNTYGIGGYITACHATGIYPPWWKGLRYNHPVKIRCCGDTRQTMREIIQPVLLGNFAELGEDEYGTGMIPLHLLGKPKTVSNTNGLVDFVKVKHVSGGWSTIQFRAYEQGRKAFQGTKFHFIWEDEEPPELIHEENEMRGRGVDGKMLLTFTPLSGFSGVVESFLAFEKANTAGGSLFCTHIGWNDVPHLTEEWKRKRLAKMKPHLRKSRVLGIPSGGDSMVYPVEEEFYIVNPFPIPSHFRRVAGFDHGWHNTAAVWLAYDKDEDVAYLYSEYKRGEVTTEQHATAMKARGAWIPVKGDSSQRDSDGKQIINKYKALGVRMSLPDKAVDAGIQDVFSRLDSGRLKVFRTCTKWLDEVRRYRYKGDDNGMSQIVKENDHLMDATRYAVFSGLKVAEFQPTGRVSDITSDLSL